jgi:peptide/nickel transport system permease protein
MRQSFYKKFFKIKLAATAFVFIILVALMAILAYLIAPDNTINANRIIPEIGSKKPGFTISFLCIPKNYLVNQPSTFSNLFFGKTDEEIFIPITQHQQTKDSLIIQKFLDEGLTQRLGFTQVIFNNQAPKIIKQTFYLGTDKFGRDMLSRIIIGTRVSLLVGCIAVILSLSIGVFLGAIAGYFKGWVDEAVMWFINVIWSIPTLLLVFAFTLILGKGFWQVFVAVGLTMWVNVARLVRGQVLGIVNLEYIQAARALGYSHTRTIIKHILPNILGPVIVISASNFASAIVIEAGLSFLGVGVQPPQPSWGLMMKENYNFIITNNPILALAPGIAIMLLVLAFNLVGNGLRDAMSVKKM